MSEDPNQTTFLPPDPNIEGWHWLFHNDFRSLYSTMCAQWLPVTGKWWCGGYLSRSELAEWRYHAPAPSPEMVS